MPSSGFVTAPVRHPAVPLEPPKCLADFAKPIKELGQKSQAKAPGGLEDVEQTLQQTASTRRQSSACRGGSTGEAEAASLAAEGRMEGLQGVEDYKECPSARDRKTVSASSISLSSEDERQGRGSSLEDAQGNGFYPPRTHSIVLADLDHQTTSKEASAGAASSTPGLQTAQKYSRTPLGRAAPGGSPP
ncbi:hypothetical protein cyc_02112 [Cyclospora cayetanensis]|uniref:Uncharacterized protein n=1 Tax=Cyclospora cayetanensis TaxID=88456 RepID=A0A1D3CWQ1_9EIME|nr:hypothetical protein cyc_02112 [Cyclospora cayetanensis]